MDSLMEFLTLDGYGAYVWGSVLMCALVAALEVAWLRQQRQAMLATLREDTGPAGDASTLRAPRVPVLVQVDAREDAR